MELTIKQVIDLARACGLEVSAEHLDADDLETEITITGQAQIRDEGSRLVTDYANTMFFSQTPEEGGFGLGEGKAKIIFFQDECSELATDEFFKLRKKAMHCSGGDKKLI